jgi:hypothetical protein
MNKPSLLILGFLFVVLAGIFTWSKFHTEAQPMACTEEAKLCPDGSAVGRTGPQCEFAACPSPVSYEWKLIDSEPDSSGMPYTLVSLVVAGNSHDLGPQTGSCHEVKPGENGVFGELADPGEVSRVQCWFAGGGVELGVFKEGMQTVIKSGLLDEGSSETGPNRGNWKALLVI